MTRLVLMIVLAIVLTTSCKEEEEIYLSEIEGTYVGTYNTAGPELLLITTPTIELKNRKFNCNGLSNGGFHDLQSGNFTIRDNKIIFELTHIEHDPSMPNNIDLSLAPWHEEWLLSGEYEYKIEGTKLTLSKIATVLEEQYKFEFELSKKSTENASR